MMRVCRAPSWPEPGRQGLFDAGPRKYLRCSADEAASKALRCQQGPAEVSGPLAARAHIASCATLTATLRYCRRRSRAPAPQSCHPGGERELPREEWTARAKQFRVDVRQLFGHLTGERFMAHPVVNFFKLYYNFDPTQDAAVTRWTPGLRVRLTGVAQGEIGRMLPEARPSLWTASGEGVRLKLGSHRLSSPASLAKLRHSRDFLADVWARKPFFGCHGVHEWAMLYKDPPDYSRHQSLPLRASRETIERVVAASCPLLCTHFDATRHYTPAARSLNLHRDLFEKLGRDSEPLLEQPGCLHVAMDLFQAARVLWPYLPSELLVSIMRSALRARVLDMRASPYDLRGVDPGHGNPDLADLRPVKIETPEGREEYAAGQKAVWQEARGLSQRLIAYYDMFLADSRSTDAPAGSPSP